MKVFCCDLGGLLVESIFVIFVLDVNEVLICIIFINDKVKENMKSGFLVVQIYVIDLDNVNMQV